MIEKNVHTGRKRCLYWYKKMLVLVEKEPRTGKKKKKIVLVEKDACTGRKKMLILVEKHTHTGRKNALTGRKRCSHW